MQDLPSNTTFDAGTGIENAPNTTLYIAYYAYFTWAKACFYHQVAKMKCIAVMRSHLSKHAPYEGRLAIRVRLTFQRELMRQLQLELSILRSQRSVVAQSITKAQPLRHNGLAGGIKCVLWDQVLRSRECIIEKPNLFDDFLVQLPGNRKALRIPVDGRITSPAAIPVALGSRRGQLDECWQRTEPTKQD